MMRAYIYDGLHMRALAEGQNDLASLDLKYKKASLDISDS